MIDSVQTLWSADLTGAPGQRRPGAGGRGRARALRARARLRDDPRRATSPRRARSPARACSSTRSTACCSSRASASAASARCGRSRTASARRTRSASSRCAPAGSTEVADPSDRFLRDADPVPGSCVLCAMEGTRPLLVEVQALVAPTDVVPPAPRRERHRPQPAQHDPGGACPPRRPVAGLRRRVRERRRRSAHRGAGRRPGRRARGRLGGPRGAARRRRRARRAASARSGSPGELRYVAHADRRLEEAARFGLERVVLPGPLRRRRSPTRASARPAVPGAARSRRRSTRRSAARRAR